MFMSMRYLAAVVLECWRTPPWYAAVNHQLECFWIHGQLTSNDTQAPLQMAKPAANGSGGVVPKTLHQLAALRASLLQHTMYGMLDVPERLRVFMQYHVFAVW